MKNFLIFGILAIMILLLPIASSAQDMQMWDPNLTTISAKPRLLSERGQHPEEGILPWNAPCTDCEEDISARTPSERYFHKGSEFWVQKSAGVMHYKDAKGRLISIDPRLSESHPGQYSAMRQSTPTFIDIDHGSGLILSGDDTLVLNHDLALYEYRSGVLIKIADADWSSYTVGDNGIYVKNIFPSIDLAIVVNEGEIESDFIINEALPYGTLVIEDAPILPSGWSFVAGESESLILQKPGEEIGAELFRPVIFDMSGVRSAYLTNYEQDDGKLRIYIDSSYLHDVSRVYPIIVDPLVTSTATYGAGSMEFKYNGSFCAGGQPDCAYNLSVPLPASLTLTGATLTAEYRTVAGGCAFICWMSDAGFFVSGPCANYPAGLWLSCISPGGDAIGTCSGAGINIFSTVSCLAPVCSGNVNFTINNSYCWCNTNGTDCTGSLPCQRMNNNTWIITLTGRNLETLGDGADGNGSIANNVDCCDPWILDPTPDYGVPPYTYLWGGFGGGGSTASDTTVFSCADGVYTYTCDVTDACGVTRTATFNLTVDDCGALPIELVSFEGTWIEEGYVELVWNTESEQNNDYFTLSHSFNADRWEEIATIPGGGSSSTPKSYWYEDHDASRGLNYYKLTQTDYDGARTDLSVVAVYVDAGTKVEVYPNPASDMLTVETNMPDSYIAITDITGRGVLPIEKATEYQNSIDISTLSGGVYFVLVMNERSREMRKFIKE